MSDLSDNSQGDISHKPIKTKYENQILFVNY